MDSSTARIPPAQRVVWPSVLSTPFLPTCALFPAMSSCLSVEAGICCLLQGSFPGPEAPLARPQQEAPPGSSWKPPAFPPSLLHCSLSPSAPSVGTRTQSWKPGILKTGTSPACTTHSTGPCTGEGPIHPVQLPLCPFRPSRQPALLYVLMVSDVWHFSPGAD